MSDLLKRYARRMERLVKSQRELAGDLREIMKDMRADGFEGGVLKQWIAAIIDADGGDDRKLQRLKTKTQEAAIYADVLGYAIPGFGEAKRFVVNQPASDGGSPAPETESGVAPPEPAASDKSPIARAIEGMAPVVAEALGLTSSSPAPIPHDPVTGEVFEAPEPGRIMSEAASERLRDAVLNAPPIIHSPAPAEEAAPAHNPGGGHEVAQPSPPQICDRLIGESTDQEGRAPQPALPPDDLLAIPDFLRRPKKQVAA